MAISPMRHPAHGTMAEQVHRTEFDERAAAADYLAELSADLALLARRHGFDTLGYILEMARLEAEEVIRKKGRRH